MSAQCPHCQVHMSRCRCEGGLPRYGLGRAQLEEKRAQSPEPDPRQHSICPTCIRDRRLCDTCASFGMRPHSGDVEHCKSSTGLAIDNAERAGRYLEMPILATPTGDARNLLTEGRLLIYLGVEKLRAARKAMK